MINFGAVETKLLVGNAPQSPVDVARLKQMRISAVLSLQSDYDFKSYKIDRKALFTAYDDNDIQLHRIAIIDFDEIDLGDKVAEAAKTLNQLFSVGHSIYVHCNAGVCRAPATILTYLCFYRGMTIEEGLDYIRLARPQANPYLKAVERGLHELNLQKSASDS